jgi:hypothetical protein
MRAGQNFYGSIAAIQTGTLYYPLGVLGKIPHVDFADVGRVRVLACLSL